MNKKGFSFIAIVLVVVLLLGAGAGGYYFYTLNQDRASDQSEATEPATVQLSDEIERVLDKKTQLIVELSENPELVENIRAHEGHSPDLSDQEIKALDEEWTEGKNPELFEEHLSNDIALMLLEFQEENPGFPEIFVTDSKGLNTGQTNKTSDYYQADEEWWLTAYNEGKGKVYHGEIEFDESAQSESIALYVPVYDDGEVVGIIKAILDLRSIQDEL